MAKKLGNNYRLRIGDGTTPTEVFSEVKGQQNLSISRSVATIDTSTKDTGAYKTQAGGQRSLTINYALIPDLPDATGYTALETWANAVAESAKNFQIVDVSNSDEVVFQGSMSRGDFNTTFDQNDSVKATGTLLAAAAPTTDVLA